MNARAASACFAVLAFSAFAFAAEPPKPGEFLWRAPLDVSATAGYAS